MPFFSLYVTAGVIVKVLAYQRERWSALIMNFTPGDCYVSYDPGMPAQYSFLLPTRSALLMSREYKDEVERDVYMMCKASGSIYVAYTTVTEE